MNTQPDTALKTLQLLLRCGMVCREELNIVLETMTDVPPRRRLPARRSVPQQRRTPELPGAVQLPAAAQGAQNPQNAFVFGLD